MKKFAALALAVSMLAVLVGCRNNGNACRWSPFKKDQTVCYTPCNPCDPCTVPVVDDCCAPCMETTVSGGCSTCTVSPAPVQSPIPVVEPVPGS